MMSSSIRRSGTASSSPTEITASPTHKGIQIANVLWYMKKNAYADTTIRATGKRLRHLQNNCNLTDPEDVKGYIANKQCSTAYKETLIEAYDRLMRSINQEWTKPFYARYDKLPRIPTEEKINMLISNANTRIALFLSMSKDLGTRPIELTWLQLKDINLENGIVNITSAKHCVGRTLKLKSTTLQMLKAYINKKGFNLNDRIFPTKSETISEKYRIFRNKLARKLQDPIFKTIRLYDFRHFKASMEYHKTKDLLMSKPYSDTKTSEQHYDTPNC
ncbi:MAG: tyrosine-type recombinase/integrase [Candidatus Bathyarchaeota archaeon]|nr:tyrosine-type recombinase/integrase [Candidatus Bathyarchaeota archaeon]